MPIFGGNTDHSPRRPAFSPSAKREAIESLNRSGGGTLSDIFWLLDTPGAMARGAISGLATGNPGQGLAALTQNSDDRVDGREMLGDLGLDPTPGQKTWTNFGAGIAAEMVTDPLALFSGPIKALTPAGKIASKAGLLQNAGEALSRKYLAGEATGEVADLAQQAVSRIGRDVSPTDILGRPLVGPRAARRYGTLGDVIDYSHDPEAAATNALAAVGGNQASLDALRSSSLGKDLGFGLPMMDPLASFSIPGGDSLAAGMDALGEAARWSAPGRVFNRFTDSRVGGAFGADDQMMTAGANIAKQRAAAEGRREATYQAGMLRLSEPDTFSEEGNRALGRSIEKPIEDAHEQADNVWQSSHPAARQYMSWWDEYAKESPEKLRSIGLRGEVFSDPNVSGYLPRRAEGALEMAGASNPSLGRALSTMTSDQMQRADEMMVPGGRDTIAFELSKDPFVAGGKRAAKNDAEATAHIAEKLFGKRFPVSDEGFFAFDREYEYGTRYWTKTADGNDVFRPSLSRSEVHSFDEFGTPAIDKNGNEVHWVDPGDHQELFIEPGQPAYTAEQMKQAASLAGLLHRLPDHIIKDVPLYGQHPVEMITRYVEGREGAAAVQGALLDSLAYQAKQGPAQLIEGGRHVSLKEAISRVSAQAASDSGSMDGAVDQIRQRLAARFKTSPDSISLAEYSVPEDLADRLSRATDTYSKTEASQGLMQHLNNYNATWKASILSWPSKMVRDFYSGGYSNWLEGAASSRGVGSAYGLLSSGPQSQSFLAALKKTPLYSTADDDAIARFWADLSQGGLLDTGMEMDRGISVSGGKVLATMPGAVPETFGSALAELGPQAGRSWKQYAVDIAPNPFPSREQLSRGPVVRFGAKAGNLVDKINRLSGYMELLMQGVAPQEAARRMKRAHVDYSSLTPYEKWIRDRIMPFYAYTSRSMAEVVRQMAERPGGRYAQGLRTYERMQERDDGEYTPSYLRQNFAAPIPSDFPLLGTDTPGMTRYLTDIDLPGYDQLNMIVPGDIGETGQRVAQMAHPAIRTAVEFGTGRDAFTGQDLRKGSSGSLAKIGRAVTGDKELRVPSALEKIYDLVPGLSRPTRAIAQAVDPTYDIDVPSRLTAAAFTNLTGAKVRDNTDAEAEADAIRRLKAMAAPYSREYTTEYINDAMRPNVPKPAAKALDLANQMQADRLKKKNKGKKKPKR